MSDKQKKIPIIKVASLKTLQPINHQGKSLFIRLNTNAGNKNNNLATSESTPCINSGTSVEIKNLFNKQSNIIAKENSLPINFGYVCDETIKNEASSSHKSYNAQDENSKLIETTLPKSFDKDQGRRKNSTFEGVCNKKHGLLEFHDEELPMPGSEFASRKDFVNYVNEHGHKWMFFFFLEHSSYQRTDRRLEYACIFKKHASTIPTKGLRKRQTFRTTCPCRIVLVQYGDEEAFKVRHVCYHHDHELSPATFAKLPLRLKIPFFKEIKDEILDLISLDVNIHVIKKYIFDKTDNKYNKFFRIVINNLTMNVKKRYIQRHFTTDQLKSLMLKTKELNEQYGCTEADNNTESPTTSLNKYINKRRVKKAPIRIRKKHRVSAIEDEVPEENYKKSRLDATLENIKHDAKVMERVRLLQQSVRNDNNTIPWDKWEQTDTQHGEEINSNNDDFRNGIKGEMMETNFNNNQDYDIVSHQEVVECVEVETTDQIEEGYNTMGLEDGTIVIVVDKNKNTYYKEEAQDYDESSIAVSYVVAASNKHSNKFQFNHSDENNEEYVHNNTFTDKYVKVIDSDMHSNKSMSNLQRDKCTEVIDVNTDNIGEHAIKREVKSISYMDKGLSMGAVVETTDNNLLKDPQTNFVKVLNHFEEYVETSTEEANNEEVNINNTNTVVSSVTTKNIINSCVETLLNMDKKFTNQQSEINQDSERMETASQCVEIDDQSGIISKSGLRKIVIPVTTPNDDQNFSYYKNGKRRARTFPGVCTQDHGLFEFTAEDRIMPGAKFKTREDFLDYTNARGHQWMFFFYLEHSSYRSTDRRFDFVCAFKRHQRSPASFKPKGIRKRKEYKTDCPCRVSLVKYNNEDIFTVRQVCYHHDHELSPEMFANLPPRLKIPQFKELKEEILDLAALDVDRSVIYRYVEEKTNNKVNGNIRSLIYNYTWEMQKNNLQRQFSSEKLKSLMLKIKEINKLYGPKADDKKDEPAQLKINNCDLSVKIYEELLKVKKQKENKELAAKKKPQKRKKKSNLKKRQVSISEKTIEENGESPKKSRLDTTLENIKDNEEVLESVKSSQQSVRNESNASQWETWKEINSHPQNLEESSCPNRFYATIDNTKHVIDIESNQFDQISNDNLMVPEIVDYNYINNGDYDTISHQEVVEYTEAEPVYQIDNQNNTEDDETVLQENDDSSQNSEIFSYVAHGSVGQNNNTENDQANNRPDDKISLETEEVNHMDNNNDNSTCQVTEDSLNNEVIQVKIADQSYIVTNEAEIILPDSNVINSQDEINTGNEQNNVIFSFVEQSVNLNKEDFVIENPTAVKEANSSIGPNARSFLNNFEDYITEHCIDNTEKNNKRSLEVVQRPNIHDKCIESSLANPQINENVNLIEKHKQDLKRDTGIATLHEEYVKKMEKKLKIVHHIPKNEEVINRYNFDSYIIRPGISKTINKLASKIDVPEIEIVRNIYCEKAVLIIKFDGVNKLVYKVIPQPDDYKAPVISTESDNTADDVLPHYKKLCLNYAQTCSNLSNVVEELQRQIKDLKYFYNVPS